MKPNKQLIKPVVKPAIRIGKSGITDAVVAEIKARLKKEKTIKIRILKSARNKADRHTIANEVAEKSNAILTDVRGNTFTLKR